MSFHFKTLPLMNHIDIHLVPFLYHWVNDYIDPTNNQRAKTKPKIKDDHAYPRHWSPTEDKSENLDIQRTSQICPKFVMNWFMADNPLYWPAGDSMIHYMCSLAHTISQRAEKDMCIWYSTGSTTAYQRTIVCPNSSDIRATENSLHVRKHREILWKNLCQYSSISR